MPCGLYMVVSGQCKVGSEKLNIRSKKILEYSRFKETNKAFTLKGNFKDSYIREE